MKFLHLSVPRATLIRGVSPEAGRFVFQQQIFDVLSSDSIANPPSGGSEFTTNFLLPVSSAANATSDSAHGVQANFLAQIAAISSEGTSGSPAYLLVFQLIGSGIEAGRSGSISVLAGGVLVSPTGVDSIDVAGGQSTAHHLPVLIFPLISQDLALKTVLAVDKTRIKQHDRRPFLLAVLRNEDGSAVNLVGSTVLVRMRPRKSGIRDPLVADCTVVAPGTVQYAWAEGDTAIPGTYDLEFQITLPDETTIRVPTVGFVEFIIEDSLQ